MSIETVQHERFCKERKLAREKNFKNEFFRSEEDEEDLYLARVKSIEPDTSFNIFKHIRRFIENLFWVLECNHNGPLHSLIVCLHLGRLIHHIIKSIIYSTSSTDRDIITQEYRDPLLRTLESY